MSLEAHVEELKRRHKKIEEKIETKQFLPSVDSLDMVKLKREKLSLKDEITRISKDDLSKSDANYAQLH